MAQQSIIGVNACRLVAVVEQAKSLPPPPTKAGRINIKGDNWTVFLSSGRVLMRNGFFLDLWYHFASSCQATVFVPSSTCFKQCEFEFSYVGSVLFCFFLDWVFFLLRCFVGLCFSLVLAGSHCVYGREAAWRAWTRSRLAPWHPIKYTWKVSVLTSFYQRSYFSFSEICSIRLCFHTFLCERREFDCCSPWNFPKSRLLLLVFWK